MFPLISLFLILGYIPLQGQGLVFQKDIYIAENEVQDNAISFGGEIIVKGKVNENVIAFGGKIIVEGEVGEVVLGFGTEIILKSTAVIKGDVVSIGGPLDKEPGAIVEGDTTSFSLDTSEDVQRFLKSTLSGSLLPLLLIIKLITLFIWFILALIVAAIFPRQITFASDQIRKSFWPIFGIGFLGIIIFVSLVVFSAILCFILIGIPILLSLIFIGIIIKIFGRVVLFFLFGEILSKAFGKTKPSLLLAVILGFILVSFISFIPILGALLTFVLSIIGWGVVIRTKFGTTENWFRKKLPNKS